MSETLKLGEHIKRVASPGDRIFEPVNDLLIILSAIAHAASMMVDGSTHKIARPVMRVRTRWPLAIPLRGPLEMALTERVPAHIEIGIITDPSELSKVLPAAKHRTNGLLGVMSHVIAPIFLMFFERYNDWLDKALGEAVNWPPTLNFARVVRNSVAHGKITIRNPAAEPVSWRDLTYSYPDNGRKIVGEDVSVGEIIALIFDASDALDAISAPILGNASPDKSQSQNLTIHSEF